MCPQAEGERLHWPGCGLQNVGRNTAMTWHGIGSKAAPRHVSKIRCKVGFSRLRLKIGPQAEGGAAASMLIIPDLYLRIRTVTGDTVMTWRWMEF